MNEKKEQSIDSQVKLLERTTLSRLISKGILNQVPVSDINTTFNFLYNLYHLKDDNSKADLDYFSSRMHFIEDVMHSFIIHYHNKGIQEVKIYPD